MAGAWATVLLHITPNCALRWDIPIRKSRPKCISHSSYALCLDVIFDNKYPLFDWRLSHCKWTKFNLFLCKRVNVSVNSLQYSWGYENCMSLFNSKCNCLTSVLCICLHRLISPLGIILQHYRWKTMALLSCRSCLWFLNNCAEFKIQFSAVNLWIIMHTTFIYAGFVLSAYIIVYAGSVFFGTPCRCILSAHALERLAMLDNGKFQSTCFGVLYGSAFEWI